MIGVEGRAQLDSALAVIIQHQQQQPSFKFLLEDTETGKGKDHKWVETAKHVTKYLEETNAVLRKVQEALQEALGSSASQSSSHSANSVESALESMEFSPKSQFMLKSMKKLIVERDDRTVLEHRKLFAEHRDLTVQQHEEHQRQFEGQNETSERYQAEIRGRLAKQDDSAERRHGETMDGLVAIQRSGNEGRAELGRGLAEGMAQLGGGMAQLGGALSFMHRYGQFGEDPKPVAPLPSPRTTVANTDGSEPDNVKLTRISA